MPRTVEFNGLPLAIARLVLRVLIVCRISTVHQNRQSLSDQRGLCESYIKSRYGGPTEIRSIESQGSGERLDSASMMQIEEEIENHNFDLLIVEDLGRICRRNRALDVCELIEDMGGRLIAINDSIDTAQDSWRMNALFASYRHEISNKDTSLRIRRTLRERFKLGQIIQTVPFGYCKPENAKSDIEVFRIPEATPIIEKMVTMLEDGASYCEVADWLNENHVGGTKWSRTPKWTDQRVANLIRNPILKGIRLRNQKKSVRVNKTGRYRCIKAPKDELLVREVPHLAFLNAARYDRLIATLNVRHGKFRRKNNGDRRDCREGVSRKRTNWPGQSIHCGICGRLFYWGGNGEMNNMMCRGAKEYKCWNVFAFNGHMASDRILNRYFERVEMFPDFSDTLVRQIEIECLTANTERTTRLQNLTSELSRLDSEIHNLTHAIARHGLSDALSSRLTELESQKLEFQNEFVSIEQLQEFRICLPNRMELLDLAREKVGSLDRSDPSLKRTLDILIPEITVYPCMLLGSNSVGMRAVCKASISGLVDRSIPSLSSLVSAFTVDLFNPPQRVLYRSAIIEAVSKGVTQRKIAKSLGIKQPIVQQALRLDQLMKDRNQTDPYQIVTCQVLSSKPNSRTQHKRYRFEPLKGYPKPPG